MIQGKLGTTCGRDTFAHPAPVVPRISLTDLAGHAHPTHWPGLLDTGAERSAVPFEVCEDLGLAPGDWRSPRGFDRQAAPRRVPLYYMTLVPDGSQEQPCSSTECRVQTFFRGATSWRIS